jgi:autotransporter-associated beta strand protein
MTTGKNAFAGSLTVGDGVGAANSAVTRWLATNEIPGVAVSVNSDGLLDLNNFSENAISTLTMTSGSVTTGTGTLTLGGNVTGNASSTTASISGNLSLGSADRTFTIASGSTPSGTDMNISAVISGAHNITKAGAGNLVLSGANTYTGTTTVNGGTLTAAASSGSALGTTTSITVNSGATLALGASNQINDTATLTLSGGTFSKGNFAEGTASSSGIGTLILTGASSHIDFGTGTVGILSFASFTPNSNTLTIDNWTGSPSTVGNASTDRLIFNADETTNLSFFLFTGYGAGAATEISLGGGFFEVVPLVPEINPRLIIPLFCAFIIALGRSRQRT